MPLTILDDDLIHSILTSISDFATLSAALRTCKWPFYEVFQAHPTSIVRAIARNACGPAYESAVKLAFCKRNIGRFDMTTDETQFKDYPLNRELTTSLEKDAVVVRALEDLFSLSYKDKTSSVSALSYTESLCFHRAVYRLWLFSRVANDTLKVLELESIDRFSAEEHVDLDAFAMPDNFGLAFLNTLSTDELLALGGVFRFLTSVLLWRNTKRGISVDAPLFVTALDPSGVYKAWKGDDRRISMTMTDGFPSCWQKTQQALTERGLDEATQLARIEKAIVIEPMGGQDACARCHKVKGLELWGPTNWHVFCGAVAPDRSWWAALPGNLPHNIYEIGRLDEHLSGSTEFVEEMFELDVDTGSASDRWDSTEWYCTECLREFVRARFWQWAMRNSRDTDDCWYGYDCLTEDFAHASRFNHLCVPTREM